MEKEKKGLAPDKLAATPPKECSPLSKSVSGTSTQTINYDMTNNRVGPQQIHVKSHNQPFKHQKSQQLHHQQQQQQQPKYTKIQPAIAPKPVAPQPSTFSPIVTSKSKPVNMQVSSSDSVINTSKRWVLPPRPRPGRKPTSDEIKAKHAKVSPVKTEPATDDIIKGPSPKRVKVYKKELDKYPTPTDSTVMRKTKSEAVKPSPPEIKVPIPELTPDAKTEILNLKESYLAKLKEQELIRNYIEVISNQIKELSFVQNGVITFDALRNTPLSSVKIKKANGNSFANMPGANATASKPSSQDQLESINNLNDLNKFLGYLTRSSNLIHSVTKKKKTDKEEALNNQINYYVDIRSKFKTMQTNEMKKVNSLKKQQSCKRIEAKSSSILLSPSGSLPSSLSSTPGPAPTGSPQRVSSSKFTPDLLKPLHTTNLFDQEMDEVLDLMGDDYTPKMEDELLMDDRDFMGMMREEDTDTMFEEEKLGSVKIHDKQSCMNESWIKKKLKLNCGFCTNDTPCLCLDAEVDLSRLI